jgi:NADPH:quinone reductase-like Zn-dependent oxidoreductase
MKAVLLRGTGGVEVLHLGEYPDPVMKEDELLVRVKATALNRADLLQRRGKHPPPKGVPDILGLEMAGEVVDVGAACEGWAPGDGRLVPIVDSVFDWREAAKAHERMESNVNIGKIVLRVTG